MNIFRYSIFFIAALAHGAPTGYMFGFTPWGVQQLILNGTTTISADFTGWWDASGAHSATNTNYIAGNCCDTNYNNFFVFSLASNLPSITSAALSIGNPFDGYSSANSTELLQFWDVTTPVSTLTSAGAGLTGVHADLGSGVFFGSRSVSATDNGSQVLIPLNSAAIAALNSRLNAGGGTFAFGGSLSTIPEPSTTGIAGLGVLAVGLWIRRRRHS
jgi:hypothetical protein